jgi:hypothetical protein
VLHILCCLLMESLKVMTEFILTTILSLSLFFKCIIILCHNLLPFALAGEGGSGARATGMEKKTQQFSMWKQHELSRLKNNKLRPCGIILQLGSLDGHLR